MGWVRSWLGRTGTCRALDVMEAKHRQANGALLIDVRDPDEWRAGHAPLARHIPFRLLPTHLNALPRDRDVLLICRSGKRSAKGCALLARHGFRRAFNVSGGMLAWTQAGLPITTRGA
jgi:rhodanese-related sulfurtransferase